MSVKLYLNNNLVGYGECLEIIEGEKMKNKYNRPSKIKIQLTSDLEGRIANIIIIDDKIQYSIELDENLSYYKGDVISGYIFGKLNLQ